MKEIVDRLEQRRAARARVELLRSRILQRPARGTLVATGSWSDPSVTRSF
jgi:hypothetical protein